MREPAITAPAKNIATTMPKSVNSAKPINVIFLLFKN
jgi:hypothetical protein